VSKVGMPVSDTVYYYRHTFTIIGSLIVIFFVTFYGNNTLHAFLPGEGFDLKEFNTCWEIILIYIL
jgi:hypothetical protein